MKLTVINRIRPRPLLPEHKNDAHGKGIKHLPAPARRANLREQRHLFMPIEIVDDIFQLPIDFRIILRARADLGERFPGFGDAVLLHKPARGFGLEEDSREQQGAGEHLKGEGDSPLFGFCGGDGLVDAVVDEVGEHYARDAVPPPMSVSKALGKL